MGWDHARFTYGFKKWHIRLPPLIEVTNVFEPLNKILWLRYIGNQCNLKPNVFSIYVKEIIANISYTCLFSFLADINKSYLGLWMSLLIGLAWNSLAAFSSSRIFLILSSFFCTVSSSLSENYQMSEVNLITLYGFKARDNKYVMILWFFILLLVENFS